MREQYYKWYSNRIGREFEMLSFGHSGVPVIIYPTSMGKYYQNKDFKLVESASWFVNQGRIKVYCPDSLDKHSWYNKGAHPATRVINHIIYDDFILNEVVYRAMAETGHSKVVMAGCSFGGYHAANFAFRHPETVSYLFSLSGAFDIRSFLHGYYDENVYFNNPVDYMSNLGEGWHMNHIRRMGIVLASGEHDSCKEDNYRLSHILHTRNIKHWLDVKTGAHHDWPYWRDVFPYYLSLMQ